MRRSSPRARRPGGAGRAARGARTAADACEPLDGTGATRLFVDRVFTLHGIGTVATGTLWSGRIGAGDELRAEPAGLDVRVRSVEVHDRSVERAEAGQRVAVSLPGIERTGCRAAWRSSSRAPTRSATGSTSRWRSSSRSPTAPASTSTTARPRRRRGSSGPAGRTCSCACRSPSSRRAATGSSCAPERRSRARSCSTLPRHAGANLLSRRSLDRSPRRSPRLRGRSSKAPWRRRTAGLSARPTGAPPPTLEREGRLVRVGRRLRDRAGRVRAGTGARRGRVRAGRGRSRSPASGTCSAARGGPRSSCSSGSTATASPSGWATCAGSGDGARAFFAQPPLPLTTMSPATRWAARAGMIGSGHCFGGVLKPCRRLMRSARPLPRRCPPHR